MKFASSWNIKDRQRFLASLLPSNAYCFDIGANYGEFSTAFLSVGARRVVAVEPQHAPATFIGDAFPDEISTGRLVLRTVAVGDRPGFAKLYPASDTTASMSTLSPVFLEVARSNGHQWDEAAAYEVPVITLDSLIDEFGIPDYIKIDVEGYDLEVLRGLSAAVGLLSFEFNTQAGLIDVAAACIEQIKGLGAYEFNYHAEAPGMTALQFDNWVSPAVMRYTLLHDIARYKVFGDIFARRRNQGVGLAEQPAPACIQAPLGDCR